jgi:hypothetical protein
LANNWPRATSRAERTNVLASVVAILVRWRIHATGVNDPSAAHP